MAGLGGSAPYWQSYGYDLTGNRRLSMRKIIGQLNQPIT